MAEIPPALTRVMEELGRLPGIGPKTAQRLSFYILRAPRESVDRLATALVEVKEGLVRIEFRYPAHAELMQKASNRETLLAAVREIFGADSRIELVAGEKKPPAAAAAPGRPPGSIADDPLVKEAMNRFDATNVRVTPRGRG